MNSKNNAKFAFYYMLSLVALIFMSIATGMIVFQIINKVIPDAPGFYQGSFIMEALKFGISAIVVSAPIYFVVMTLIMKNLKSGALTPDSPIRRWLTYLILLVSSVVAISWLVGIFNTFLNGDLTVKFILKALTAIGIAAIVFSFYLYDVKRDEAKIKNDKVIRIYFIGALVIIAAVFVASLFFVDSPATTRNKRIDNEIINVYYNIDGAINTYYMDLKEMPKDLATLDEEIEYIEAGQLVNPYTKKDIEYKVVGEREYELCTDFLTSNMEEKQAGYYDMYYYGQDSWFHEAGYQCSKRKVRIDEIEKPVL